VLQTINLVSKFLLVYEQRNNIYLFFVLQKLIVVNLETKFIKNVGKINKYMLLFFDTTFK